QVMVASTFCISPKDMVNDKFPFSRDFGNGAVVPLGKVIIKNDFHVLFEIGGVFAPRFIHLVQNPYCHAQARRSLRPCDEVLCDVHGVKDHPALHKKSGQKSDSAVNKDFLASFWRLFKTKKSLFGRKKHRQGTLFVQSLSIPCPPLGCAGPLPRPRGDTLPQLGVGPSSLDGRDGCGAYGASLPRYDSGPHDTAMGAEGALAVPGLDPHPPRCRLRHPPHRQTTGLAPA